MKRPLNAAAPEIFQAYFQTPIAPIQRSIQRETQASNSSDVVRGLGSFRQNRKPVLCRRHVCSQQFALSSEMLDLEYELITIAPRLFSQRRAGCGEIIER